MTRLVVTKRAQVDIETIALDLGFRAGNATASRYVGDFHRFYDQIARFPSSGAPRPRLGKGIRMGSIRPYAIIYRFDLANDMIFVLRVLHGKRHITRALLRELPGRHGKDRA